MPGQQRTPCPVPPPRRRADFALLWLGDTVNALGSSITLFVLPLIAVRSLHASALQIGLLSTFRWLPALLVGLPAGAWVERREKRRVCVGCNLASGAVMAAVPVLAALAMLSMTELYAVVAAAGAVGAVFSAGYVPYLSTVLAPADYRRGISRVQAARTAAQFCGPALGGVLATLWRPSAAILIDVASFAFASACLSRLPRSAAAAAASASATLARDIRDGVGYLRREPYLRWLTGCAAAENLFCVAFGAIEVVFLLRSVHAAPRAAGYLLALGAIGSVAGAVIVPRVTAVLGDAGALRGYLLLLMPASTLICLTERGLGYVLFAAGETAMAIAITGVNVIVLSFRQTRVPGPLQARVSATMQVLLTSTMPLGGILGGALAQAIGVRGALWVILPCTALPGLVLLRRPFARLRDLPAEPSEEPGRTSLRASG
jgi:MFS family permease